MAPPGLPASLTVATFNLHLGVDGWGRPFDVVAGCRSLDADVLVLQESWAPSDRTPSTARLVAAELGYRVVAEEDLARGRLYRPLATPARRWGPRAAPLRKSFQLDGERWARAAGPPDRPSEPGRWGVALLSRVAVGPVSVIPLGKLRRDAARRVVLACTVDLDGGPVQLFGTHMSHITHGSHLQYRRLARELPPVTTAAVLTGDMNLWGPPVRAYFPGWRRAVTAPTWPAHRPHSQLDHVLVTPPVRVVDARVAPFSGSDHLPVVVRLALDRPPEQAGRPRG
jgi:endonuclease/exonuclease/phosphatase family metal-dependent hydrolase